jgi:RNA recognition motif-containing protein
MPATSLFVGNLPYGVTEQGLRELFERQGVTVTSARIVTDFDTGRSKGYGFVEASTPEEARTAISALHQSTLEGRTIVVNAARASGRRP